MALHEIEFLSYNERDTVKGWIYVPIYAPKGIVQIVHGFGEHSRRYLHMIDRFLDAGYIVAADDHVGHGKTAVDNDSWGDFGDKGYLTTIEDEHTLRRIAQEKFPGLPHFIFGHSWGCLITRSYTAHYGDGLAGAVYCGAGRTLPTLQKVLVDLEKEVKSGRGKQPGDAYLGRIFEGLTDRYPDPKGPNDWIALSPEVVADHGADPLNSFASPNIQSLYDFVNLFEIIHQETWMDTVPKTLPIFHIGGDQDPITNFGEDIYHISNKLIETGHTTVTTKVYSGYRHEVHNEPPIREEVISDLISFFDTQLETK